MIRYVSKKMKLARLLKDNTKQDKAKVEEKSRPATLSTDLKDNLDLFSGIMGNSPDFIVRHFTFGKNRAVKAALLFMDGLADKKIINESIIKPLMYDIHLFDKNQLEMRTMEDIENILLSVGDVQHEAAVDTMISRLLYGDTIMLVDGYQEVLIIDTKGWQSRSIQEPPNERVVRGPREGFTETIRFNTAMLRRKINNPDLTVEQVIVGQKTHTYVALVYLKGIVNPKLVEEVKQRLKRIKTDAILESGYIEQFIEDSPLSLFTTVGNTEKPDVAAAKILEGRVAILIDGSPMVLTVPMLFVEGFQSAEDYYSRPYTASLLRMLRFASFFITLLSPALYVAMTTYHQEFIPTPLLITMKAASEGTPFPAVFEILLMGLVFEILREGGIRLPSPVGQALSIVGALIIGDAAVSAGLIGAPLVIVIALTAVSSFLVNPHQDALILLRFVFIILAGILGAVGIVIGLLFILVHLCSIRSFGTPYLSPLAPFTFQDMKDTFIRAPIWTMLTRPQLISKLNKKREVSGLEPGPEQNS